MKRSLEIICASPAETARVGATLADWLRDGDVVLLHGDLGAGKTTLAKGIAAALQVDGVVSSPSFALVNEYETGLAAAATRLLHLDLFRLAGDDDLASIGFDELAAATDAVALIEWPERANAMLPDRYVLIELSIVGSHQRQLRITPVPADDGWATRIEDLFARFDPSSTQRP
ncbi:MAG: tRNA (adenosine(37)-N6)-threonylcarbamoyltransferase complex ATPase subunit type 1 TsaE [Chloroflexia bacterium]|nr:tRNA (adenosine(37)-N6)-threonylcarbamoyltransferase complex ATPase subunit type 1 TsaE [Chloroflexia bacterium]